MRARVHDAEGPGGWRFLRVAFGPVFFLFLFVSAWEHLADRGVYRYMSGTYRLVSTIEFSLPYLVHIGLVALTGISATLWPLLLVQRRPRLLSVRMRPGLVKLGWGIWPWQRIWSSDVEAIRVARAAEGTSVVLIRRHGSPVFLELDDEDAARSIKASLLEGGAAVWDVSFPARTPRDTIRDKAELLVRALGVLCWVLFFVFTGVVDFTMDISTAYHYMILDGIRGAFSVTGALCVAAGFCFHLLRPFRRTRLVLDDREICLGTLHVKYADITSVNVTRKGIGLGTGTGNGVEIRLHGLSDAEIAHVAAHIQFAVQLAKGTYAEQHSVPGWLAALSPGKDEPVRAWLTRLDAVNCERGGDPYRRSPFDREELEKIIDDGEAPVVLRAAAARVLRRIDPADARKRVDKIEARIDPDAARRLRVAIEEDIEEASVAYETLPPLFRVLEREDETR